MKKNVNRLLFMQAEENFTFELKGCVFEINVYIICHIWRQKSILTFGMLGCFFSGRGADLRGLGTP